MKDAIFTRNIHAMFQPTDKQYLFIASMLVQLKRDASSIDYPFTGKAASELIGKLMEACKAQRQQGQTQTYNELENKSENFEERDDCAVIAVSAVTGRTYDEAHAVLQAHGRFNSMGTFIPHMEAALKEFGFGITKFSVASMLVEKYSTNKNIHNITTLHPKKYKTRWDDGKKYLFICKQHVAAVVDGQNHDWSATKSLFVREIWRVAPLTGLETATETKATATLPPPVVAPVNADQLQTLLDKMLPAIEKRIRDSLPITHTILEKATGETKELAGRQHHTFPKLVRFMSAKTAGGRPLNIWMAGPAGGGKSHGCHAAADLLGLDYFIQGAMSMPHDLIGFIDANGKRHDTPFTFAFEFGGVIVLEELDSGDPASLLVLQTALANGAMSLPGGRMVTRHKDCRVIGCANTWGEGATGDYIGRNKMDKAFLNRFVMLSWNYDEALEVEISGDPDWARHVQKARAAAKSIGLKVIISPRASIDGAALVAQGFSYEDAMEATFLAGITTEQRRLLMGAM
jgi:hypothetical protein